MRADPVAEWRRCGLLRQPHIDRLLSAGVPVLALAEAWWGGMCLMRDRVVVAGARFEFARYAEGSEAREAFLVLAFDRDGHPADLVAFRGGDEGFIASWLGLVGMLGEEQLDLTRNELTIHPDPLAWLCADRRGVVIVDPVRAGPVLRDEGPLAVASHAERRRVERIITPRLPRIIVTEQGRQVA